MIDKIVIQRLNKMSIEIEELLNMKLIDLECKHIPLLNDENNKIYTNSEKIGYKYALFGSHRVDYKLSNELNRIENMSNSNCLRAVRVVLTNDGKIWSDNTHWTIAYIYKFGKESTLRDIPIYIVDLRYELPIVIDCDNTLFDSVSNIQKAILASLNIQNRISKGWRKNQKYTISNFLNDLERGKLYK